MPGHTPKEKKKKKKKGFLGRLKESLKSPAAKSIQGGLDRARGAKGSLHKKKRRRTR